MNNKDLVLVEIMKEIWTQARHVETQRLWFTNIYVILVAAVLAFLGNLKLANYQLLVGFLIIVTFVGLLFALRTNYVFYRYQSTVRQILKELDSSGLVELPRSKGIWKIIQIRFIFILFYITMIFLWLYLFFIKSLHYNTPFKVY